MSRLVLPPPGPLIWSNPELAALDTACRRRTLEANAGAVLDLAATPRHGPALLEALHAHADGAATLRIPDAPTGHALASFLRGARQVHGTRLPRLELDSTCADATLDGLLRRLLETDAPPDLTLDFDLVSVRELSAEAVRARQVETPDRPLLVVLRDEADRARMLDLIERDLTSLRCAAISLIHDAPSTRKTAWWGLLPDDAPSDSERARQASRLTALLTPDRTWRCAALVDAALAGHDLYGELLLGRHVTPPWTAPGRAADNARPPLVAVCGIDGSGKSSHVAGLRSHLAGAGLDAHAHKIYRHGVFHDTVTELTRRCAGGQHLVLWRLQRLGKVLDSLKCWHETIAPTLGAADVVVADRWTPTHHAAGCGRLHHDPFTRELLASLPRAELVALLDLPAEDALERIGTRGTATVDENAYMLDRFRQALSDQADRDGWLVLDARAPHEQNQARLRAALADLQQTGELPRRARPTPAAANADAPLAAPAQATTAPTPASPEAPTRQRPNAPLQVLLTADGEPRVALQHVARAVSDGRVPIETAVHMLALEFVIQVRERQLADAAGAMTFPFWPPALAATLGVDTAGLDQLMPLAGSIRLQAGEDPDAALRSEAQLLLGVRELDLPTYRSHLADATR